MSFSMLINSTNSSVEDLIYIKTSDKIFFHITTCILNIVQFQSVFSDLTKTGVD